MSNNSLFSLCNALAMFSWIALALFPRSVWVKRMVQSVVVILFAIIYGVLVVQSLSLQDMQSFGSLEGVMQLFTQPTAVLVGWVHYLAFDLMMGLYVLHSGQRHQIHHALLIPCLFFTFMLGPVGLLLFTIVRTVKTKNYWVDYL